MRGFTGRSLRNAYSFLVQCKGYVLCVSADIIDVTESIGA